MCVTKDFQFCVTYRIPKRPVLICVTIDFSVCMTIAIIREDLSDLRRIVSVVLGRIINEFFFMH